jgi:uncharacterized membrane protein
LKINIFRVPVLIDLLTIFLVIAIIFIPSSIARVVLGLPFLLFFPGYMFVAVLFPETISHSYPVPFLSRKTRMPNSVSPEPLSDDKEEKAEDPHKTLVPGEKGEKRGAEIGEIERLALGFGMSIAIASLIGLGLNYTPWGIRMETVLYSISTFIIVMSVIALFRQKRYDQTKYVGSKRKENPKELPGTGKNLAEKNKIYKLPGWEGSIINKISTVFLALSILIVIGVLGYAVIFPKVGERFTEFYILGSNGKAEAYPSDFVMSNNRVVGVQYGDNKTMISADMGQVIIGIVNREQQNTSYSVIITIDNQPAEVYYNVNILDRVSGIELPPGGKREQVVGFKPHHAGNNQKVEFLLYRNNEAKPESTVHFWINVKEE